MHPLRLEFRFYQRPFQQPLRTHHGVWAIREGIVLRLTDPEGRIGWGEIAPIAFFGSETLEQALKFCQQLPSKITAGTIAQIPPTLPACQFGFESALSSLHPIPPSPHPPIPPSAILLPTGLAALHVWQPFWEQGSRTFNWKIGVAPFTQELEGLEQLVMALPPGSQLRLDANGGLSWHEACEWLQHCDRLTQTYPNTVEFLEQPLPTDQVDLMLKLSQQFVTSIALDESVATLKQIKQCYRKGWRGVFVIKAAISGSPIQLRKFCQEQQIDVVWSSVFETTIARSFIENYLIAALPASPRAIGFGVNHWFAEGMLDQLDFELLWQSL